LTVFTCLFLLHNASAQDTIRMRDHTFITGETADVDEDFIVILVGSGESKKPQKIDIENIQYVRYKNGFLEKYHEANVTRPDTVQLVNYQLVMGSIVEVGDSLLTIKTGDTPDQVKNILIDSIANIAYASGFKEKYNALAVQTISGSSVEATATDQKKDLLITVEGLEYHCYVSEITETSVKIVIPESKMPVMELNKTGIAKIVYGNGYVENYNTPRKGVITASEAKLEETIAAENKEEETKKAVTKKSRKRKTTEIAVVKERLESTDINDLLAIPVSKSLTSNAATVRSAYLNKPLLKKAPQELGRYTELAVLNFSSNILKDMPDEVLSLPKLELLRLDSNYIRDLSAKPDFAASKIAYLSARHNSMKSVDSKMLTLPALKQLDLSNNQITGFYGFRSVKDEINIHIDAIDLSDNKLKDIPEELYAVHDLKKLYLGNNQIRSVEIDSSMFDNLELLNLSDNPITRISDEFFQLNSLQTLLLHNTKIEKIDSIGRLTELRTLSLPGTLKVLPKSISDNENLREIYLQGNPNITSFPASLLTLNKLELISLNNTPIKSIPSGIGNLKRLKSLFLANCGITTLPESLFQLPRIKQIHLNGNRITSIPARLGDLAQLELLNMENSPLTGEALMTLRKSIPFAYIKYFSTELGLNFESKPLSQDEEPRFQALMTKCLGGTGDACYELGNFFEKRNDYGYAFKLYYLLATRIAKEGSEEAAIAYSKIADMYNDRSNRRAYNSIYKTRNYSSYGDYTQNGNNNIALKIYCKLCDEASANLQDKPVTKRACANASLIYNETVNNLKKIFEDNSREIQRLIGGSGSMNNLSAAGTSMVNAAQNNTTSLLGAGLSIFGKVAANAKETKANRIQNENNSLKRRIEDLNNTATYYLNKAN